VTDPCRVPLGSDGGLSQAAVAGDRIRPVALAELGVGGVEQVALGVILH
jgi:hypothetical protein